MRPRLARRPRLAGPAHLARTVCLARPLGSARLFRLLSRLPLLFGLPGPARRLLRLSRLACLYRLRPCPQCLERRSQRRSQRPQRTQPTRRPRRPGMPGRLALLRLARRARTRSGRTRSTGRAPRSRALETTESGGTTGRARVGAPLLSRCLCRVLRLAPVPAPPGTTRTEVTGPLAQSATALHISTRTHFWDARPPPRNPIIVSVTSPAAARRNVRGNTGPQDLRSL